MPATMPHCGLAPW